MKKEGVAKYIFCRTFLRMPLLKNIYSYRKILTNKSFDRKTLSHTPFAKHSYFFVECLDCNGFCRFVPIRVGKQASTESLLSNNICPQCYSKCVYLVSYLWFDPRLRPRTRQTRSRLYSIVTSFCPWVSMEKVDMSEEIHSRTKITDIALELAS